jgi:hypothetical protein
LVIIIQKLRLFSNGKPVFTTKDNLSFLPGSASALALTGLESPVTILEASPI